MTTPRVKEAERAYTAAQVAELKGVSKEFVYQAIRATSGNALPAKRIGKGYRITASDVESWWAGLEDA
jgi:excisionase family DNA binding protein